MVSSKSVGSYDPDKQLRLDFPKPDTTQSPFLETPANASAVRMFQRWKQWPDGQMCLVGDEGSGKTRLLKDWAEQIGAGIVSGADLDKADISSISGLSVSALVVDDADLTPPGAGLLAALNLCKDRGAVIALAGKSEPSKWMATIPDLQSRLTAMPVVHLDAPDEETLQTMLIAACKARFMKLPEDTAKYLAHRMERSYAHIDDVVQAMEQSANGKALTKVTARNALEVLSN